MSREETKMPRGPYDVGETSTWFGAADVAVQIVHPGDGLPPSYTLATRRQFHPAGSLATTRAEAEAFHALLGRILEWEADPRQPAPGWEAQEEADYAAGPEGGARSWQTPTEGPPADRPPTRRPASYEDLAGIGDPTPVAAKDGLAIHGARYRRLRPADTRLTEEELAAAPVGFYVHATDVAHLVPRLSRPEGWAAYANGRADVYYRPVPEPIGIGEAIEGPLSEFVEVGLRIRGARYEKLEYAGAYPTWEEMAAAAPGVYVNVRDAQRFEGRPPPGNWRAHINFQEGINVYYLPMI